MDLLTLLYYVVQYMLFGWLGYSVLFILTLSIAGCFYRQNNSNEVIRPEPKVAVLIPAYKENAVIINTVQKAFNQTYDNFDVIVIADSLNQEVINELQQLSIILIEVDFEKSTKAKALNYAMDHVKSDYDLAVVLDADNVMEQNVLRLFVNKYVAGYNAIQGHRTAKNLDSRYAILDSVSEEMNNHIYSKGAQSVGLSCRLVGSGMAIEYNLFQELMSDIEAVGGFDKVLQLRLIDSGNLIKYVDDAYIYDEKVNDSKVFSNQRLRWTSSQYYYFRLFFISSLNKLIKGKVGYFLIFLNYTFPPRLLFPVLLFFLFVISLIVNDHVFTFYWGLSFVLLTFAYIISIPRKLLWTKGFWRAIVSLPSAIIIMVLAMFKLKGANKTFIHTPHTHKKPIDDHEL